MILPEAINEMCTLRRSFKICAARSEEAALWSACERCKSVQDAIKSRDRVSYEWEIDTLNLIFINNLRGIRYVKYSRMCSLIPYM